MLDRRKDVTLLSLEAQSWLVRDQFPFRAEKATDVTISVNSHHKDVALVGSGWD